MQCDKVARLHVSDYAAFVHVCLTGNGIVVWLVELRGGIVHLPIGRGLGAAG